MHDFIQQETTYSSCIRPAGNWLGASIFDATQLYEVRIINKLVIEHTVPDEALSTRAKTTHSEVCV